MLIINGIVHTMDGQTIPRGFVAVSGGKIARVGAMEDCPANWEGETVDAGGDHVLPGFIDAHSHLGMFGDAVGFEGDDGNEATDPCTPHLRAIDAIYPQDRCFQEAREGGVTTVLTGPGSANPVSGQFAAIKTAGRWVDEMIVKAPAAMKMALGENPKCVYNERHETPVTRMATAAIIRENLSKALEYGEKLDRAEEDEDEERPDFDPKLEALLPVVRGELPVHIHAHRADDIATGVRIAKEFHLKCVIVHGTEGHLLPELLAAEGIRATVVNMHTVKPLDEDAVLSVAEKCGAVVTAEEHSVIGGLGSAVAEVLAGRSGAKFARVGIEDRFGQSGTPAELFADYGLTAENIAENASRQVKQARKNRLTLFPFIRLFR